MQLEYYEFLGISLVAVSVIIWNSIKIISSKGEWVAVKGTLVEYEIRGIKDGDGLSFDLSNPNNELYHGCYEFTDTNGEARIHISKHGYDSKSPKLGTWRTVYYQEDRPSKTADYSIGDVDENYIVLIAFGIILIVATWFYL